jgi:cell division septal protein FtsQ
MDVNFLLFIHVILVKNVAKQGRFSKKKRPTQQHLKHTLTDFYKQNRHHKITSTFWVTKKVTIFLSFYVFLWILSPNRKPRKQGESIIFKGI